MSLTAAGECAAPIFPFPNGPQRSGPTFYAGDRRPVLLKPSALRIPLPLAQLKEATAMVLKSDKAGFFGYRRSRKFCQNVPYIARVAAGAFGFLTLIQVFDGPDRYGASSFFETIPSSPRWQTAANILSP
jgi:hypothetical protein